MCTVQVLMESPELVEAPWISTLAYVVAHPHVMYADIQLGWFQEGLSTKAALTYGNLILQDLWRAKQSIVIWISNTSPLASHRPEHFWYQLDRSEAEELRHWGRLKRVSNECKKWRSTICTVQAA